MAQKKKSATAQNNSALDLSKLNATIGTKKNCKKPEVTFWDDVIEKALSCLIAVYLENSSEVIEHVKKKVSIDLKKQPSTGISFKYQNLELDKFISKSKFENDIASEVICNYYNACIINGKPYCDTSGLLANVIKSAIDKLMDRLTIDVNDPEIFEYLDDSLKMIFQKDYPQVKTYIDSLVTLKPNIFHFDYEDISHLGMYINFEFPQELQIMCMNIYHTLVWLRSKEKSNMTKAMSSAFNHELETFKSEIKNFQNFKN